MNAVGKVLTVTAVLAVLATVGGISANDVEKKKCEDEGGTWHGLLKGCSHNCVAGEVWDSSTGRCVSMCVSPLVYDALTNSCVQLSLIIKSPTNLQLNYSPNPPTSDTVQLTVTWNIPDTSQLPSGSYYTFILSINGVQTTKQLPLTTNSYGPVSVKSGSTVSASISTCTPS